MRQAARKSIGQALAELTAEFPDEDIKESKLRFLEAEGLVEPERTPSGYRKYSTQDMERLRYIIRAQREHYLPLKVIKEHLDAMDRGLEPPALNGGPTVPAGVLGDGTAAAELLRGDRGDVRISRRELIKTAEITDDLLDQLETYGLVHMRAGSRQHYDGDALVVAKAAGALAAFGIEPRHLRAFKTAADREIGLVEQVVTPIRRSREEGAEGRAAQAIDEIATLSLRLHATLVRQGLRALR
ncbi:MAG TPA: MerR family transcriptional regulator [Marmoricola sp.]|nr:MerR family transcriptional regulator [Marmoricola sp.]